MSGRAVAVPPQRHDGLARDQLLLVLGRRDREQVRLEVDQLLRLFLRQVMDGPQLPREDQDAARQDTPGQTGGQARLVIATDVPSQGTAGQSRHVYFRSTLQAGILYHGLRAV